MTRYNVQIFLSSYFMSYRKFFKIDEIFIIRKILEYADLGLDIFFDEHQKKHYLKFDPNNQKFSSIDTFFSRIFYHYRKSIICIFNTQIHFISSELTFPPHKTISFFQITENNKKIISSGQGTCGSPNRTFHNHA
jgi:hypothetical protein